MKYKGTKNRVKTIIVSLVIMAAFVSGNAGTFAENGKEIDEISYKDWLAFSASVISFEDFKEYWVDIFYRYNKNICHYMDIANIQNKMHNLRTQIREAYYANSYNRLETLKTRYTEMEVELYYVRNFVTFPHSDVTKISDEKIYREIRRRFHIENPYFFYESEVKELFDRYNEKYESRVQAYKDCQDPGLQALIVKWDSLVENLKAMSGKTEEGIQAKWNQTVNTPVKRTAPFTIGNTLERLDNLPAPKTVLEIQNEAEKDVPEHSAMTIEHLQRAVSLHREETLQKEQTALLMAEYETLYKKGGDSSTTELVDKLKEINKIITDTLPILDTLESCAKKTGDRQCS